MATVATADPSTEATTNTTAVCLIGLDLGTNASCLKATTGSASVETVNTTIPTVVGYAKDGILDGILPDDASTLFGEQALRHRLHLRMERPLHRGIVDQVDSARDFLSHLRTHIHVAPDAQLRAVIGIPARADSAAREAIREAVKGVFDQIILIPEPFLAALGFRDESRLGSSDYIDPVNNSLFIDMGAGSSDLCLVQGYYPLPDDQVSIAYAGDAVDQQLAKSIRQKYPESDLSMTRVREIKEHHSYVGELAEPIVLERIIGGKTRRLDLGEEVGQACEELLRLVFEGVRQVIAKANPDTVPELLGNIVLTGGCSRISGFAQKLEELLKADGYEQPKVRAVGEDFKQHVARGALKAACAAKERQWQNLMR